MAAGEDAMICPMYKTLVKDSAKGMQCDGFCDLWHHSTCVKIYAKDY